jgi:hypothetical protein
MVKKAPNVRSGSATKNLSILNPKYKSGSATKNLSISTPLGNMILDVYPGSGFFPFRFTDPGVKKALVPGSGSLTLPSRDWNILKKLEGLLKKFWLRSGCPRQREKFFN